MTIKTGTKITAKKDAPISFGVAIDRPRALAIRAVALCASDDVARPILAGISIEGDGSVCATDSYRLATMKFEDWPTTPNVLIPAAPLAKALASLFKDKSVDGVTLQVAKGWWTCTSASESFGGKIIEGEFPDWRALVEGCTYPDTVHQSTAGLIALNPGYLETIHKAKKLLNPSSACSVRFKVADSAQPIYAEIHGSVDGVYRFLLMPVRIG